ncbi:hypothetical protein GCM10025791_27630 [Halioxenophilus aromaticivorans]|uniref:Uncharacterized protein n=2 Tax=Halioxenophilus aromaticivorans TaxID=1306992 RepID=A0AAV3U495_9ALTE
MRSKVSGWVDASSRSLDSYFGTDDFLDVDNRSYLRVSEELEWMDSEGFTNSIGTRFKVDMPTTKKRLKLVFESNPEETQTEEEERNRRAANRDLEETKNSSVIGLEKSSDTDPKKAWRTRVNGGLKLRTPLDPYLRVSSRRMWEQKDGPWYLESYNRASWFNSEGYSVRSRWELNRRLSETSILRFTSQLQWREEQDKMQFGQRVELSKVLNARTVVRWAMIAELESASNLHVEDYYVQMNFRRDIHDEVLFLDFVPELHFAEEDEYDPRWAVILRLEFYFRADFVKE